MKGIIYKITNDINDKIYIGKTEGKLNERWSKHMYDLQDNFIKKFNSIADANSYFNKNRKNGLISRVCDKNNRTAYGYKWKS